MTWQITIMMFPISDQERDERDAVRGELRRQGRLRNSTFFDVTTEDKKKAQLRRIHLIFFKRDIVTFRLVLASLFLQILTNFCPLFPQI